VTAPSSSPRSEHQDAPAVTWVDDYQPGDHTPTPFDLRQAEMEDLRGQGPTPLALWTASTVPARSYL
jgi:hypothetical protein